MINVPRDIVASAAIDGPLLVDAEEVFAIAPFDHFIRNPGTRVLDDPLAFGNQLDRK